MMFWSPPSSREFNIDKKYIFILKGVKEKFWSFNDKSKINSIKIYIHKMLTPMELGRQMFIYGCIKASMTKTSPIYHMYSMLKSLLYTAHVCSSRLLYTCDKTFARKPRHIIKHALYFTSVKADIYFIYTRIFLSQRYNLTICSIGIGLAYKHVIFIQNSLGEGTMKAPVATVPCDKTQDFLD